VATGGGGSLESALSLTAGTSYTVTVGAGGAGGAATNGSTQYFQQLLQWWWRWCLRIMHGAAIGGTWWFWWRCGTGTAKATGYWLQVLLIKVMTGGTGGASAV
jgi:hypothetical protein